MTLVFQRGQQQYGGEHFDSLQCLYWPPAVAPRPAGSVRSGRLTLRVQAALRLSATPHRDSQGVVSRATFFLNLGCCKRLWDTKHEKRGNIQNFVMA